MTNDNIITTRAIEQIKLDLGLDTLTLLEDPKTVEIMLNPDGSLWVEQLGAKMRSYGNMNRACAISLMQTIASYHGTIINTENPILECEFPLDNSRFAGQFPPVVANPTFTIRKKAISIFTLAKYVENCVMTEHQKETIQNAIKEHKNILVIGGTGSGKTTLVNAVIHDMTEQFPDERVVIIEDTGEIQCAAKNYVQFKTSKFVKMTDLLKTTLRMRPDRILVGEVRGAEALDLLMAWNTGHEGGAATVHANNPLAALDRIALLISMNSEYPKPIEPLIGSSIHYIVHIGRENHSRKIKSILKVHGYDTNKKTYITENI